MSLEGEVFGMSADEVDRRVVGGPTDDDAFVMTKDGRLLTTRQEILEWLHEIGQLPENLEPAAGG